MSLQTSRLAPLLILLVAGALLAGCAAPQESGDPGAGASGNASVDDPDRVRPTLPAFDVNGTGGDGAAPGDATTPG